MSGSGSSGSGSSGGPVTHDRRFGEVDKTPRRHPGSLSAGVTRSSSVKRDRWYRFFQSIGPVDHRDRDREIERRRYRARRQFGHFDDRHIDCREVGRGSGFFGLLYIAPGDHLIPVRHRDGERRSSAGTDTDGAGIVGVSVSGISGTSTGITSTSRPAAGLSGSCTGS